jgi:hypothetical protein
MGKNKEILGVAGVQEFMSTQRADACEASRRKLLSGGFRRSCRSSGVAGVTE